MRISAVKSWLLAALSLARPAASQDPQAGAAGGVFTFNPYRGFIDPRTTNLPGKPAVIAPPADGIEFQWNITDNAELNVITLYHTPKATKDEIKTMSMPLASSPGVKDETPDGSARTGGNPLSSNIPRDSLGLTVTRTSAAGGTLSIDFMYQLVEKSPYGNYLYFEAAWTRNGRNGRSYSRLFKVFSTDGSQSAALTAAYNDTLLQEGNRGPALAEEQDKKDPTGTTGTSKPTKASSTDLGPALATSTNTSGEISATATSTSSNSDKKGLSIGAIVGIAIACGLIGLALIGGIVFFCLRRRQKQNALGGGANRGVPYGGFASGVGRNGGDELMSEKEANAGVIHDVTSSPNSPYSDDGNHQQHLIGMGGIGAGTSSRNSGSVVIPSTGSGIAPHAVLPGVDSRLDGDGGSPVSNTPSHHMQQHDHQSGKSYTMYSDHQSGGGGGSPTTLHSGAGGTPSLTHGGAGTESNRGSLISQQQQGRSSLTPYAHLIEEGMTEEQIRTLEEEERQLDAAIEQHVGGQRGSRNL